MSGEKHSSDRANSPLHVPIAKAIDSESSFEFNLALDSEAHLVQNRAIRPYGPLQELTVIEIRKENTQGGIRNSTVYTNLSSDSAASFSEREVDRSPESLPLSKRLARRQMTMAERSPWTSFYASGNGLPTKVFCTSCGKETIFILNYEVKELGFWGSLMHIISSMRCCGDTNRVRRTQSTICMCTNCGDEVKI